jgi:hypothetical protein
MSQYWFRAKTYGYGATPTTWQGWVAVAAYLAVFMALTVSLLTVPAGVPAIAKAWQVGTWIVLVGVMTFSFVRIARAKTDGQLRWRWGK